MKHKLKVKKGEDASGPRKSGVTRTGKKPGGRKMAANNIGRVKHG